MSSYRVPLPPEFHHRTLPDMFRDQAEKNPNRLALVAQNAKGLEERLTYAQLRMQAERLAYGFQALGVKEGDRIAIMADNSVGYEASVTLLACFFGGFVAVPINARFAREEIDYAIGLVEARLLVYDQRYSERLGRITERINTLDALIRIGEADADFLSATDWQLIPRRIDEKFSGWPDISEDSLSEILFTSGSTARPKAVMQTSGSGVYAAFGFADALSLSEGDVYQSFFPFFTTAGIRCVLTPGWFVGATVVLDTELDINAILKRIEREQTTVYVGVPSVYVFLLEAYDPNVHDLSSLRVVNAGGAAFFPETLRGMIEAFPGLDVRQTYGGTEGGPSGTVLRGEEALDHLGSAGKPWPYTEIRIADDDGKDVPNGELGEILVRSPGLLTGYYGNDRATRETLREGWLRSGDIGKLDDDGYLYVVDRKKDMVIRGGHNIGTLEVETVLLRHKTVSEVAVIGVPHAKLGEDLIALIKSVEGANPKAEELIEFCQDKLADYKVPRNIRFVDSFPRSGMGKILKRELREQYSAGKENIFKER